MKQGDLVEVIVGPYKGKQGHIQMTRSDDVVGVLGPEITSSSSKPYSQHPDWVMFRKHQLRVVK